MNRLPTEARAFAVEIVARKLREYAPILDHGTSTSQAREIVDALAYPMIVEVFEGLAESARKVGASQYAIVYSATASALRKDLYEAYT